MQDLNEIRRTWLDWFDSVGREQQIKDYLALSNQLMWQRQLSFLAAVILTVFYTEPISTLVFYALVAITEVLDQILGRQSRAWDGHDPRMGRKILSRIVINTFISATAISFFVINIAVQQTLGGQLMPLFFLFSASLFAAMYNSQMSGIMGLRLSIYFFAFIYIATRDIFRDFPPLSSHVWLDFFTTIFVLFIISSSSVKFYLTYQERLKYTNLLRNEHERTKAALEAKSRFLATVSHELRTPLTSIIGPLTLINNQVLGELPDNVKPAFDIATKNGKRLAIMINDLLDLQQIEAGEITFSFEPLDVKDLVMEAVESMAGYASKLDLNITTVFPVDECRIMGDRNRLLQVVNNLLSNALKFSNKGIAVVVRVEGLGDTIRISVEDGGVGIPKGVKDRVFGKFGRVYSPEIGEVKGTGLGLNIAQEFVHRHNATIEYVSELGMGSTFLIEFDRLT